jgi:hypothetical protein
LFFLIAPVFNLRIGQSRVDSLATSGPAFDTVTQLRQGGVGSGVLTPIELLVPADRAGAAVIAARDVAGVHAAVIGATRDGSALVDVLPRAETVDSDGTAVVEAVRTAVQAATGGEVGITGAGAAVQDYSSAVYDNFPYVLLIIAVITFVLLARTFRSVLLPLKAVLLNLVSLAAVFGAVVFFWQQGHGSQAVFGVAPTGAITFWLPVIIFAFLFGLSMDYEVFILTRMREEYDATGSTSAAVVGGLGRTGRLVTSAALILFFAFAALASAPGTDIKVFGTALGAGIVIDATVVRALLVPALVSLFGRWNWWLPDRLATLLRVEPSPMDPPEFKDDRLVSAPDPEPSALMEPSVTAVDPAPDPEPSPSMEPSATAVDPAPDPEPVISGATDGLESGPWVEPPVIVADSTPDHEPVVSGSVRGHDRGALVGVPVTLIDTAGRQIAVFRTGPEGSYRFRVPTAGSYLLAASASGHHPAAFLVTVLDRPVQREIVLTNLHPADPPRPQEAVYELGASRDSDYW